MLFLACTWGPHAAPPHSIPLLARIAHERFDVVPNAYSYNAAISACGRAGDWERAVALIGKMNRQGIQPNAVSFNSAISACGKRCVFVTARTANLLASLSWTQPCLTRKSANDNHAAFSRQWSRALELLREMGPAADVFSYGSAMSACEQSGEWVSRRASLLCSNMSTATDNTLLNYFVNTIGDSVGVI